jgi:hypothetical protein
VYACARVRDVEVAEAQHHEQARTVGDVLCARSSRFHILRGGRGIPFLALMCVLGGCSMVYWSRPERELSLRLLLYLAPLGLAEATAKWCQP